MGGGALMAIEAPDRPQTPLTVGPTPAAAADWDHVIRRARLADTGIVLVANLLAMLCLVPLFTDLGWVTLAAIMVVVVAVVGAGSRAIGLPLPLVPVAETMAVLITLTAMFAGEHAWAGLIPTSEAWDTLRIIIREGMIDADALAAPVPVLPGVTLLAVGGVGLAALTTDTFFVSVRNAILAGIPLAALFAMPAMMKVSGAPWWTFPLAAVAWLLVLAADRREQIREWAGVPLDVRIRGLSTTGRRVGAAAIVIAMAAAIVMPVRGIAPWRTPSDGSGGGTTAEGGEVILDPLVSMRRNLVESNDTEVVRYHTNAKDPSYLRITALDSFDGVTWRPRPGLESGRDNGWPLPGEFSAAQAGSPVSYDISVTNLGNAYLPLPYPITSLKDVSGVGNDWRLDSTTGVAFSNEVAATGAHYAVTAIDPDLTIDDLRSAPQPLGRVWPQLSLPTGLSPEIKTLAADVTADAKTPYDKAVALQNFFTTDGGFTYSTSVRSGSDVDYIAEFLRDRVGYCEQFAGAMAIMARTLGIPSRVVVGFTQGTKKDDGSWSVTVRDAHAWPELWFEGVGWVRFEPTPRADATVLAPPYAQQSAQNAAQQGGRSGDDVRADLLDPGGFDPALAPSVALSGTGTKIAAGAAAVALVLLALLAVPMARRIVRRRRRVRGRELGSIAAGAWAELCDTAVDYGVTWSPYATPRQLADRWSRGMAPEAAEALKRLRVQVEQVRYAHPEATSAVQQAAADERSAAVRRDLKVVRKEFSQRVRWQARIAAYCWPPSERRRHRSSMRSMNPGDFAGRGAAAPGVSPVSTASRRWNAR